MGRSGGCRFCGHPGAEPGSWSEPRQWAGLWLHGQCPASAPRCWEGPHPLIGEVLCFWQDRRFRGASTDAWLLVRKWWLSLVFVNVTCLFFCDFLFGCQDLSAVCPVQLSAWRFWGLQTAAPWPPLPLLPLRPRDAGTSVLPPVPCVRFCVFLRTVLEVTALAHCPGCRVACAMSLSSYPVYPLVLPSVLRLPWPVSPLHSPISL